MNIIYCEECGKPIIKDYLNECVHCKTELPTHNSLLDRFYSGKNHTLKKYTQTNIDILCREKGINRTDLFGILDIDKQDAPDLSRLKEESPEMQIIAEYFGYPAFYLLYNDMSLPGECRELCQYFGMDTYALKLLMEVNENGSSGWEVICPAPKVDDLKREITFQYKKSGYQIVLTGRAYGDRHKQKLNYACKRIPHRSYLVVKFTVFGNDDYVNKNLYSDYSLYYFLFDNLMECFDLWFDESVEYVDYETEDDFDEEESSTSRTSVSAKLPNVEPIIKSLSVIESQLECIMESRNNTYEELQWLQENFPDIAPKSKSGYVRMKELHSPKYLKLKGLAREKGRELIDEPDSVQIKKQILVSLEGNMFTYKENHTRKNMTNKD